MIKGIVFDMDGLMFDTEKLALEAWQNVCGQYENIAELAKMVIGLDARNAREIFRRHLGDSFDYDAARLRRTSYANRYIEENGVPLKPGLFETLGFFAQNGFPCAVATSTDRSRAMFLLEKSGVSQYFKGLVCGDMIENGKPAPDIYLKACETLGLPPPECAALEDSHAGIISAYKAGMKPVMIPDLLPVTENIKHMLFAECDSLFGIKCLFL